MLRHLICIAALSMAAFPSWGQDAPVTITVPVIGSGNAVAYAGMTVQGDIFRIDAADLRPWAEKNLSHTALEKFDALAHTDGMLTVGQTEDAGFSISYDENQAALAIKAQPEALQTRALSLRGQYLPAGQDLVLPSDLSGFANFRAGQDYVHEGSGAVGRQPFVLDIDGAINLQSWVLEGQGDYLENNARRWRRGDIRLVRDWPRSMVRLAVGDLSYPVAGYQSFQSMAGIGIARNFSLQPYRVTEPTGQTSFILTSPSRVEIYVNNQKIRTLQLQAGPYDLSDFPIADGANDIRLVITDASGRVEEKNFPLLGNQKLLARNLHEYAYNIGVESHEENREIRYDTGNPVLSAFHRYGFTDTLTAGLSLQGDKTVQQIGSDIVKAFDWGTLSLTGAISHAKAAGEGFATQLEYGYQDIDSRQNFAFVAEYTGAHFASLGNNTPDNNMSWQISTRYSRPIWNDFNMNVGGRYRFTRNGGDNDWNYSLYLNRVIYGSISTNIGFEQRRRDGAGIMLGFTWTPMNKNSNGNHTFTASANTLEDTRDLDWNWYDNNHWQVGAGLADDDKSMRAEGNVAYTGYRAVATARHDIARLSAPSANAAGGTGHWMERRTRITAGTAIAFAGDHVALSRPVESGFIMLTRKNNLKNHAIGVDPQTAADQTTEYEARIDALGPAVLPDAVPYMYRQVRVDVRNVPVHYDIGQDQFTVQPSYKSGTLIDIGSNANIYADGYLLLPGGEPAAMAAGIITSSNKEFGDQEFFTNAKGRFRITSLQPGDYTLVLSAFPKQPVYFKIDRNAPPGAFRVGNLTLAALP